MNTSTTLDAWIVAQCSDALIYAGRDGRIERWNAAATQLFGFTATEALGQSLDIIIPEHLREKHWAGFDHAIETGRLKLNGRATLTRGVKKDGSKCYVEMSFGLVKDAQGTSVGSVAMARDVTERVEKERAAKASNT